MYEITVERHFCYGHRLINYDGPCKNLHGHNARVLVTVLVKDLIAAGPKLDMVIDFKELKAITDHEINKLDHKMILEHNVDPLEAMVSNVQNMEGVVDRNEIVSFPARPTSENIVRYLAVRIFRRLQVHVSSQKIHSLSVKMYETNANSVSYTMENDNAI